MDDIDLHQLSLKVEQLIQRIEALTEENRQLQAREQVLKEQLDSHLKQRDQVRHKVETMMSRLNALEPNS